MTDAPLVSILIPAYNEHFFGEAFASALAQRYPAIEIVVCDDSPGETVRAAVDRAADARVRYVRNPQRLGFAGNFTRCFELARGRLVKFLNDDDRLHPNCVHVLAEGLALDPAITLATSRRAVIDEAGRACPDILATTPISHVSSVLLGRDLGDFMLANSTNFVGEPSTVLFRRDALALEPGGLFRWGGRDYHCLADMSVWLRLLAKGPAFYSPAKLSDFRLHSGQEQQKLPVALNCIVERLWIAREARRSGFLSSPAVLRAALEHAHARAAASMDEVHDPAIRRELAEFAAEVQAEIAAVPSR